MAERNPPVAGTVQRAENVVPAEFQRGSFMRRIRLVPVLRTLRLSGSNLDAHGQIGRRNVFGHAREHNGQLAEAFQFPGGKRRNLPGAVESARALQRASHPFTGIIENNQPVWFALCRTSLDTLARGTCPRRRNIGKKL